MERIQLRRDVSTKWAEINPILMEGEVGFETDTKLRKIGDGITAWNNLDYLAADSVVQRFGNNIIPTVSQKTLTNCVFGDPFYYFGGINPRDGKVFEPIEPDLYLYTDYIPVTNQSTIQMYTYGSVNFSPCAFYDEDKKYISSIEAIGEQMQSITIDSSNIPNNTRYIRCSGRVTDPNFITINSSDIFRYLEQTKDENIAFVNKISQNLFKGIKKAIQPISIVEGKIWNDNNEAEVRTGYSYADYPYNEEISVLFNGAFNGVGLWVFHFFNEEGKRIGTQYRKNYSTYNPLYVDNYEVIPPIGTTLIRINYGSVVPPSVSGYNETNYLSAIKIDSSTTDIERNESSYKEEEIEPSIINSGKTIRLNGAEAVNSALQYRIFNLPEVDENSELLFSAKIAASTSAAFLFFYDVDGNLINRQYVYNTDASTTIIKHYEKIVAPIGAVTVAINSLAYVYPRLFKRTYSDKIVSNELKNSIEDIQNDLYTAIKGKSIVPKDITIEPGYLRSDGRIWTNLTTMTHTSLIPIKGNVTYFLGSRISGLAYNLIYDSTGTKIIQAFQQKEGEPFTTPSGAYYIALSLQPGIGVDDIEFYAVSNVLKGSGSNENEIITNSPESQYDIANSGNFRLFFSAKIKIDLNNSNQTVPLCTLAGSGQTFSIDAIARKAQAYSQQYTFGNNTWITDYPYATARSGFGFTIDGQPFEYANRSYPQFGELKGTELFRIRYTGDPNTSNHTIEITDTNLIVKNGETIVIDLLLSNYPTIEDLMNDLSAYPNFETSAVGSKLTTSTDTILRCPPVKMVSTYTNSISNPVLRKEAYPFVAYSSMYERYVYFELVRIGQKVCLNIDGQNDGSIYGQDNSSIIQGLNNMLSGNFNITFDTNKIELQKLHINMNGSGEAEILTCNRICSNYSKIFASWSSHGIYDGKSTNGKKPLYEDVTVTNPSTEMAVIPVKYKQWIPSGPLSNILTSSERILYILGLTRQKGYTQVTGDTYIDIFTENYDQLPNKSFIWFNDDKHIYMYTDPQTKSVISKDMFTADFAASKWYTYTETDLEAVKKMNSLGWKHYIHGEYDEIIFALTNEQLYTTDASKVLSICRNLSLAYSKGIRENVWITSNGLQSPNGINAFNYWGIPLSYNVGLGTGVYICRASNPLNLPRLAIGETQLINNVERYSII